MNTDKKYTVWCGGGEINNYYMTIEEANILAIELTNEGYDDVFIEEC